MDFKKIISDLTFKRSDIKDYLSSMYQKFMLKSIEEYVSIGGIKVNEELENIRKERGCATCPNKIRKEVLPYIITDSCKLCGCVIDIKAKFEKYKDPKTGDLSDSHCDIWNEIDQEYMVSNTGVKSSFEIVEPINK